MIETNGGGRLFSGHVIVTNGGGLLSGSILISWLGLGSPNSATGKLHHGFSSSNRVG